MRVHPLGLVAKDEVLYLVATLFDYTDVRQLALHRMSRPKVLEQPAKPPHGFSLKNYIEEDRFAYPVDSGKIPLVALFDEKTATHLIERQISEDQRLEPHPRGVVVRATVPNTSELRWWLLGFGDRVEVLGPPTLRAEFRAVAFELARRYSALPAAVATDSSRRERRSGEGEAPLRNVASSASDS
jgi:predicted DNA-binding transcriptional regulator YafY